MSSTPRASWESWRTCWTTTGAEPLIRATARHRSACAGSTRTGPEDPLLPYEAARANRTKIDWRQEDLAEPPFTGTHLVEPSLAVLREYIDWQFFFYAWELKGKYPQILDDPEKGEAARSLFADANDLLDQIVAEELLTARGVYGYWRAAAEGDDIVLADGTRFCMLRQQSDYGDGGRTARWRILLRLWRRASRTIWARLRSRPGSAPTSWRRGSRASRTITARSS